MSIFQTPEWEKFKLETGWQKSYRIDDILVLQKNLPMGRTMLYSPMVDKSQISKIKSQNYGKTIGEIAKENNTIFYRLEIDEPITSQPLDILTRFGYAKAFEEMQPEHTIVINISKEEGEILAQMKQKGRYNIRVATKHNVEVKESETVDNFYQLYETMTKRQKISHRDKEYFQKLFDNLRAKSYVKVFEARHSNRVLATAIVTYYANRATYLFGGSSQEMKNVMAPYLLHWEIMKDAKAMGFIEYDLFGVAPENQPNHPWAGVTNFKEKFGGKYLELIGSYDKVFKPFEYKLFRLAEKIRR